MSTLVEISAAGALVRPTAGGRLKILKRGDEIEVEDTVADGLVASGAATVVHGERSHDPDRPLAEWPIGELRKLAKSRGLAVARGTKKPELVALLWSEGSGDAPDAAIAGRPDEAAGQTGDTPAASGEPEGQSDE